MNNYDEALFNLNRSLQIKQNITLNADMDKGIAITLTDIGRCHSKMNNII